jgi:hypothetical protein
MVKVVKEKRRIESTRKIRTREEIEFIDNLLILTFN